MKRPEKEQVVEKVAEKMKRATAFYLTEFQGMTVAQTQELRNELRKSGIEYKVVKNTLIKKLLSAHNFPINSFQRSRTPRRLPLATMIRLRQQKS